MLPTFEPNPDGPTLPINVPQVLPENRSQPSRVRVDGVSLTWMLYRGPIGVRVEPEGEPQNGTATVSVQFTTPGEYSWRVQAADGLQTVTREVDVTVR